MQCNLRHTQTKVNVDFASGALLDLACHAKRDDMRVMLEQIRGKRNLEDIADELGVSISTVQRWEKQTMAIKSNRLVDIARAYGCSVGEIFAEDDDEPRQALPPEAVEVVDLFTRMTEDKRKFARDLVKRVADEI